MDDRGLAGRDRRGCRPSLARANGRIDDDRRALPEQRQGFLNREVSPLEIDGYHLVEALLCHVFEQQELAVTCIYEHAVQVPELPLDRGEHRVEVGESADVRANGETSGSKRLLSRLQRARRPGWPKRLGVVVVAMRGFADAQRDTVDVAARFDLKAPAPRLKPE